MRYIVNITGWSAGTVIPYDKDLENEINRTVAKYIQENIEYPGQWFTYTWVEDADAVPLVPATRVN